MKKEIKRIICEEEHFTEAEFPFLIKANFSFVGSIKEISRQVPLISFLPHGSITDFLGLIASAILEEYKLSSNPGDILSLDKDYVECDNAQGMISKVRDLE